jgi:hypothetical protein
MPFEPRQEKQSVMLSTNLDEVRRQSEELQRMKFAQSERERKIRDTEELESYRQRQLEQIAGAIRIALERDQPHDLARLRDLLRNVGFADRDLRSVIWQMVTEGRIVLEDGVQPRLVGHPAKSELVFA